jgi:hypothetical protein
MPLTPADLRAMLARGDSRILQGSLDEPRPLKPQHAAALLDLERTAQAIFAPAITRDMLPLELSLDMALYTKGNADPMHRYAAAKHNKAQRLGVYNALCRYGSAVLLTMPLTITITRIGPRLLGPTNPVLAAAKHVVDGIADWLTGRPGKGHYYDDDPRFTWQTQQVKGGKGIYAVHIRIEETPC